LNINLLFLNNKNSQNVNHAIRIKGYKYPVTRCRNCSPSTCKK